MQIKIIVLLFCSGLYIHQKTDSLKKTSIHSSNAFYVKWKYLFVFVAEPSPPLIKGMILTLLLKDYST